MKCRHCNAKLTQSLIDLGSSPPSNAYLTQDALQVPEKWFPLKVLVCGKCFLVQTEDFAKANELFGDDYAYFSGFSSSWLEHSKKYVYDMSHRFSLDNKSFVIEVAANDGYLLQYVKALNIPCLGIEPTISTALEARKKGISIIDEFFGVKLAEKIVKEYNQADLTVANNVLAHVPDINDFVSGFVILLKRGGVATFEFPHLLKLIEASQFDTIYHEHFSYLSLLAVENIFNANGLNVFDVEECSTHGGSLRVFAHRSDSISHYESSRLARLREQEINAGMGKKKYYSGFQPKVDKVKNDLLMFLIEAKRSGKKVVAYGAAAKGNTMMNYAGIREDLILYVVDRNPLKKGKYMPGSRLPIVNEEKIEEDQPDYILILPWNIKDEVIDQLSYAKKWGAVFVTAVPSLELV
jgi:SAM-dependent methyltransferase